MIVEKEARKKLKLGLAKMIAQEVWAEHKICTQDFGILLFFFLLLCIYITYRQNMCLVFLLCSCTDPDSY